MDSSDKRQKYKKMDSRIEAQILSLRDLRGKSWQSTIKKWILEQRPLSVIAKSLGLKQSINQKVDSSL